jgi:mannose-6-phosphate isomerase-like protein (cupin superfamily)
MITEDRPWGSFTVLVDEPTHKVKTITVKAGCKLSLQKHRNRTEYWTVVSGQGWFTSGWGNDHIYGTLEKERVGPGDVAYIPCEMTHRVEALDKDLVFIEVQLGDYFGEDDIERLEDDFGRV